MHTFTPETLCQHLPLDPGSCKEVFAGRAKRHRQGAWSLVFLTGRQADITWRDAAHWYTSVIDWDRLRRAVAPRASKMPQPVAVNPFFPIDVETRGSFRERFSLATRFFPKGALELWLFCPRRAPAGLYTAEETAAAIKIGDRLITGGDLDWVVHYPKTLRRFEHFCRFYALPRSPIGAVQRGSVERASRWFTCWIDSASNCAGEVETFEFPAARQNVFEFQRQGRDRSAAGAAESRQNKVRRYLDAMMEVDNVNREQRTKRDLYDAKRHLEETRVILSEAKALRYHALSAEIMTAKSAADYLKVSVGVLKRWRAAGSGPNFAKLSSRQVRYRRDELDRFVDARFERPLNKGGE